MSQRSNKEKAPTGDYLMHFDNILDAIVARCGFSTFSKGKRHPLEVTQATAMGKMDQES